MRVQPVTLENAQQRQSEAGSVLSGRSEKCTTPYGLPKKHTGRQIHQGMAFGETGPLVNQKSGGESYWVWCDCCEWRRE